MDLLYSLIIENAHEVTSIYVTAMELVGSRHSGV